jgi:hypothetical protein
MEAVQTVGFTSPEAIWATLDRVGERLDKVAQRQEELTESQKETDRIMRENQADFNNRMGKFTTLFGEIAEYMVAPKLREKFKELGLIFPKANPNSNVRDYDNNIFFEVDVMLENGEKAMVVEVKTQLTLDRINKHIERLEKIRKYADLHDDKRTFLGAVAGVVVTDEARDYALSQGFYLIEPSGENFNITPPNGKPKEW